MVMEDIDSIEYDESIDELKSMFEAREAVYQEITQDIVDFIGPTVFEALFILFNVPNKDVRWLDFKSTDNLLIVTCSVIYDPSGVVPQFIVDTIPELPQSSDRIEQTVRLGIPYELVLAAPEDIVAFLQALITSHKNGGPSLIQHISTDTAVEEVEYEEPPQKQHKTHDPDVFDPSPLSAAQRQQLLFFQHITKDKVH
jgi:hypothetical protein